MSAPVRCPACADALVAARVDGSDVRRCPSCDGIWIGVVDLHAFVQPRGEVTTIAGLPVTDVEQGSRRCPWCMSPLRTAQEQTTGTQVDWCDRHGVWLDARELDILRGHVKPPKARATASGGSRGDGEPGRVRGIVEDVAWFFGSLFVP